MKPSQLSLERLLRSYTLHNLLKKNENFEESNISFLNILELETNAAYLNQ